MLSTTSANTATTRHCLLGATILLLMAGCADSPTTITDDNCTTRVSLQIGIGNTAPRSISSWADAQQVNDMRLYLFRCQQADGKDGTYTLYATDELTTQGKDCYTIDAFDNRTPYSSAEHGGKNEEHSFHFTPTLPSGYYYRLLAVGRDDKYSVSDHSVAEPSFTIGTTTFDEASLALSNASQTAAQSGDILRCSELFSGRLQTDDKDGEADDALLVTDDSHEFSRTITLHRAVAGLMLYVKNIPSLVYDNTTDTSTPQSFTPTSLSLMATAAATDVRIASRTATDSTPIANQTLATIKLSEANGWTIDQDTHTFVREADTDNGWPANSYMATNYMMPTKEADMGSGLDSESKASGKKTTFCLHYTDGTHHRYDNIKITTSDGYKTVFPIEANHLYAIGQKSADTNEPYDLKKHYDPVMNDITIEIEPSFDGRHDFDVK